MKTYRVAMLGCRSRGTSAARAYHAHPRIEVVGLCDLVQERLDTLGDELGVSARFSDLDEMIRQTQPDLVAIPTGTEFHYPLAMRVLEHGVNIEGRKADVYRPSPRPTRCSPRRRRRVCGSPFTTRGASAAPCGRWRGPTPPGASASCAISTPATRATYGGYG